MPSAPGSQEECSLPKGTAGGTWKGEGVHPSLSLWAVKQEEEGCVCVCVHVCLLASVSYLPSPTPSLVKMRKSTFGGCPANLNPALPINN